MYSERDSSHDDLDATAHQKMTVVEPGQDAVPPQSLEVTVSNTFISLHAVRVRPQLKECSGNVTHMTWHRYTQQCELISLSAHSLKAIPCKQPCTNNQVS